MKKRININKKAKVEIDRYPMVEVHWRDIVSDSSWQSTNHLMKAQLPTCVTKGHLLSQAKGMTRIFGDFSVMKENTGQPSTRDSFIKTPKIGKKDGAF